MMDEVVLEKSMEDTREPDASKDKPKKSLRNQFQVEVWNPQNQTWTWSSNLTADQPFSAARKSLQKLKRFPQYRDDLEEFRVRVTRSDPFRVSQYKVGQKEAWPSRKAIGLSRVGITRAIEQANWNTFDSQSVAQSLFQQNGTPPESHPNPTLGH